MKRDMGLIREILLQVEARPSVNDWGPVEIDGRSQEEISYHVKMLDDDGLLEALDMRTLGPDGFKYDPKFLTARGHDFLDSIRSPSVWGKVKQQLDLPPRVVPHPMLAPAPVEGREGRASSGTRATA